MTRRGAKDVRDLRKAERAAAKAARRDDAARLAEAARKREEAETAAQGGQNPGGKAIGQTEADFGAGGAPARRKPPNE
jgi:hypothetical protein